MFTHKNPYIDIGVRGYFEAVAEGANTVSESFENKINFLNVMEKLELSNNINKYLYEANANKSALKDAIDAQLVFLNIDRNQDMYNKLADYFAENSFVFSATTATFSNINTSVSNSQNTADTIGTQQAKSISRTQVAQLQSTANGLETEQKAVTTKTKQEVDEYKTVVESDTIQIKKDYGDRSIEHKIEGGNLSADTVRGLLADLDNGWGVEQSNTGIFSRTFFGAGRQKEIIGERQVQEAMSRYNTLESLTEVYRRVTGDTITQNPLAFESPNSDDYNPTTVRWADLKEHEKANIKKFQSHLIEQADALATFTAIMTPESNKEYQARSGLIAVLEGETNKYKDFLSNPKNVNAIAEKIKDSEAMKRDPSFFERLVSTLLRLGLNIAVPAFSGGLLSAYLENTKMTTENTGILGPDPLNLRVGTEIGRNGASVEANADIAAIRLNLDLNSPEARINSALAYMRAKLNDPKLKENNGINGVVDEIIEQVQSNASETSKGLLERQTKNYKNNQNAIIQKSSNFWQTNKGKDWFLHNTLVYLAKAEKAKGFQLSGIHASFAANGVSVGPSFERVSIYGSGDTVNEDSGLYEAAALGEKSIKPEKLNMYLQKYGITKNDDGYYKKGEVYMIDPGTKEKLQDIDPETNSSGKVTKVGQQVEFKIVENFQLEGKKATIVGYNRPTHTSNTSTEAVITQPERTETVTSNISLTDWNINNQYSGTGAQQLAQKMYALRMSTDRSKHVNVVKIQQSISREEYESAKDQLIQSDLVTNEFKNKFRNLRGNELKQFLDNLLAKSSGSQKSRRLADKIEGALPGKNFAESVRKLYEGPLENAFADLYGLQSSDVKTIIDGITKKGINKGNIKELSSYFENGFTGVVGYSQLNSQGDIGFRGIDQVNYSNTRVIGTPFELTGNSIIDIVRNKIRSTITSSDVGNIRSQNSFSANMSDDIIKNLMVGGSIYAYLSFDEYAECFNLGFAVQPTNYEQTIDILAVTNQVSTTTFTAYNTNSAVSWGSTIGASDVVATKAGIGIGKKLESSDDSNTPQDSTEPGVTPGPKDPISPVDGTIADTATPPSVDIPEVNSSSF